MTQKEIVEKAEFEKFRKMLLGFITDLTIEDEAILTVTRINDEGKPQIRTVMKASPLVIMQAIKKMEQAMVERMFGDTEKQNNWGQPDQN